jgi:hypothetical protein|tara:strand:- start:348 stop:884 length:537 start_codon:yes stop_codon:yes gene_type:complete
MINDFYYKIGPVETTTIWTAPIDVEKVNGWIKDFRELDLGEYQVYLGGRYVTNPIETDDVDIMLTGPIYDYMKLYEILKTGVDLALNKYNFLLDIKHFDNLEFVKYEKTPESTRHHIQTELAGEEVKIINGEEVYRRTIATYIPNAKYVPKEIAVNVVEWPLQKHIDRGVKMPIIKLN